MAAASEMKRVPKHESRNLADLIAFPSQQLVFPDGSPKEIEDLAVSIKHTKLQYPIEILPDNKAGYEANTILSGHRRKAALEFLGKTIVQVCVRYDLADADAATIERIFIEDNFARRQLSGLGKARCIQRLFEIEKQQSKSSSRRSSLLELREAVGARMGCSPRTVDRYLSLLRLPLEIQQAFESDLLKIDEAARIAKMSAGQQEAIRKHISNGIEPKQAMAMFVAKSTRAKNHSPLNRNWAEYFEKGLSQLELLQEGELSLPLNKVERDVIIRLNKLSVQLLGADRARKQTKKRALASPSRLSPA